MVHYGILDNLEMRQMGGMRNFYSQLENNLSMIGSKLSAVMAMNCHFKLLSLHCSIISNIYVYTVAKKKKMNKDH